MRTNRWIAVAVVAAAALPLSACVGGSPQEGGSSEPLTVWVMGDTSENFDQLVAPFEDETGLEIETVAVPWDAIDQKFTAAVASGDGPDLLQIGLSKLRTFADSGALLTLDEDTLADYPNLAAENFIDGVAGESTAIDGVVQSLPWVADTRVLYYRSDILEAAGIDSPPTTWDELRSDAKKIVDQGGEGQYGFHMPQWDSPLPVIMTWDQGGDIVEDGAVDFDTPEFEKAVDLYTGLHADGSVPTASDFNEIQGFISGATPMVVLGPYLAAAVKESAPELEGKWGVTTLPEAETGTSLLAGSNLGIWADSPNTDEALQLADYLSDPETQISWFEINGELPTAKAALADEALTSDPLVKVYSEQLADARLLPLVPNWDGETGKALLDALNAIVLNGADRQQTLDALFAATAGTPAN